MRLKSILVGMLTVLSCSSLLLTAAKVPVRADEPTNQSNTVPEQPHHRGGLAGVQLTEQQKEQLRQIRQNTRSQIENVLRQDQKDRYQAEIKAGKSRREAMAAMNLSPDQKNQIKAIMESARSQTQAILTPEQQQQMRQNRQRWHQEHNQQ